jgi:hypothetical protein
MSNTYTEILTLWKSAVPFDDPQEKFVIGWSRSAPLSVIETVMTELKDSYDRGRLDPSHPEEHAGRFVSSELRKYKQAGYAQGSLEHDRAENPLHVPTSRTKSPERWRASWPESKPVSGFGLSPFGVAPYGEGN